MSPETLPSAAPASTSGAPPALSVGPFPFLGHRLSLLAGAARSIWAGALYKLNFTVTGYCNSKCVTCDIWKEYPFSKEPDPRELSLDEIERFFERLPPTLNWLSLTGGEPHARRDFVEIVEAAIRRIPNLHLVGIPSNGLLQERVMRLMASLVGKPHPLVFMSFSIDGPEEVHDRVRGVPGGFRKTWATYEAARAAAKDDPDIVVSIETTVSSQNVGEISGFLAQTIDAGHPVTITIGHNAFLYANVAGSDSDKNGKNGKPLMSPGGKRSDLETVLQVLRRRVPSWRPKGQIDARYLNGILPFLDHPRRQVVPCTALRASVSVDAVGEVHPCLMWGEPLGNLRDHDYDVARILARPETRHVREAIRQEKCPNCWTPCEAYQSLLGRILKPL